MYRRRYKEMYSSLLVCSLRRTPALVHLDFNHRLQYLLLLLLLLSARPLLLVCVLPLRLSALLLRLPRLVFHPLLMYLPLILHPLVMALGLFNSLMWVAWLVRGVLQMEYVG